MPIQFVVLKTSKSKSICTTIQHMLIYQSPSEKFIDDVRENTISDIHVGEL